MSKRNYKMVKVSGTKLRKAIAVRNLNGKDMSLEMGCSPDYVNNSCSRGNISLSNAILLEKLFGITRDEYELVEEEKQEIPQTVMPSEIHVDIDWEKLSRVITQAVYEAVSKAWNEPVKLDESEKGGE